MKNLVNPTSKNISRGKRNYLSKKKQLLKNEKSISSRFSLLIVKKFLRDIFIEISKEFLTPFLKDLLNDLFDLSNDSPIIDFVITSIKPSKFIFWIIDFLKSFID